MIEASSYETVKQSQGLTHHPGHIKGAKDLIITSAVPLSSDSKQAIVDGFSRLTQTTYGNVSYVVDSALICGVRVQSDSFVYEWSYRKQLRELAQALAESGRGEEDE